MLVFFKSTCKKSDHLETLTRWGEKKKKEKAEGISFAKRKKIFLFLVTSNNICKDASIL